MLRLAAAGLSNRDIAQRLFLSPRTVEKQVAAGLAKLQVARDQLAGLDSLGMDAPYQSAQEPE